MKPEHGENTFWVEMRSDRLREIEYPTGANGKWCQNDFRNIFQIVYWQRIPSKDRISLITYRHLDINPTPEAKQRNAPAVYLYPASSHPFLLDKRSNFLWMRNNETILTSSLCEQPTSPGSAISDLSILSLSSFVPFSSSLLSLAIGELNEQIEALNIPVLGRFAVCYSIYDKLPRRKILKSAPDSICLHQKQTYYLIN